VAVHGAACFNAVLLPRNAVLVEIMPTSLRWGLFRTLSHTVGVQHLQHAVAAPVCNSSAVRFNRCDATVDLAALQSTMDDAAERVASFAVGDRLYEYP
jgi:capsular polysaccharide biosynthesis protein